MPPAPPSPTPSDRGMTRRKLLIGGGVGVGLLVAWQAWPRRYAPNLTAARGEHIYNAFLKIGEDGHVTVAVPQAETGQGSWTALPQIVADELGADWRTVAVEPAPVNPLYANPVAAEILFGGAVREVPEALRYTWIARRALMLTAGSSSVRRFEDDLRDAGAAARVLLQQAAARRWNTDWRACTTADGFVVHDKDRLRFADLAAEARDGTLPDAVPWRGGDRNRLTGRALPRLDSPAKVDGGANFAGDVRLPGMVFAAIRQGPGSGSRLVAVDTAPADRIRGALKVVTGENWVAVVAETWWAADRAVQALAPRFAVAEPRATTASIHRALDDALAGDGVRMSSTGNVRAAFRDAQVVTAEYRVEPALHAAIEPVCATAAWSADGVELWLPTQAPGLARDAVARAFGLGGNAVTVHPMPVGGGFGAGLEHDAAVQAAAIARAVGRPVHLTWSRGETLRHDRVRPPALARMAARLDAQGRVTAWQARIAAPATGRALGRRLLAGDPAAAAALALAPAGDGYAVAGAVPPYQIASCVVDHHPADIGVETGHLRGGAEGYTCFFTECFVDELAHMAKTEALSFRIAMLGGDARMARCLSTVAALGGWEGGIAGSGQGIACHSFAGSYIAVFVEAHVEEDQTIGVDRIVAAVDCGRQINPDLVRQNVEGGLVFGMAQALGCATGFAGGMATARGFADLALPVLADVPDITVELIPSEADPGGVSDLAVPPVAPAIANALQAAMGARIRTLPLRVGRA